LAYGEDDDDAEDTATEANSDTEVETVGRRGMNFTAAENGEIQHVELTVAAGSSDTDKDEPREAENAFNTDITTTRDIADLGIVAAEVGAEAKSDDDDHGTITDDYEADSEEPVTTFDSRRYSQVTGGLSEMSLTDTIICVGFGYALVYA